MISALSDKILDDYLDYIVSEKSLTSSSFYRHRRSLRQFLRYIEKQCMKYDEIEFFDVRNYLDSLEYGGSYIWVSLSSIRSFYDYLRERGLIAFNPARAFLWHKYERITPEVMTIEELSCLFKISMEASNIDRIIMKKDESEKGYAIRDHALLMFLYHTGAKTSEAVEAKLCDLDLNRCLIRLSPKGKANRLVTIAEQPMEAIKEYLKHSRPKIANPQSGKHLFLNKYGAKFSPIGINNILERFSKVAGLNKKLTPNILRNSCIAHMIEDGKDMKSLKRILGLTNITNTTLYLLLKANFSKDLLYETYRSSHPRVGDLNNLNIE